MREPLPEGAIPDTPFAFTAGRLWDEGKNLHTLDAAAARLRLPVFAAGPLKGPNRASIKLSHVRTLGNLRTAKSPSGSLRNRSSCRRHATSHLIGSPGGAEAGCALVLSDIPTFRELWDGAACFVPPDDDAAVADAIEQLANDARQRTLYASAARRRARRYTPEVMAAKVRAIYGGLLSKRRQHAGHEVLA